MEKEKREVLERVGFDPEKKERAGSALVENYKVVEVGSEVVEMLPLEVASRIYDLSEYGVSEEDRGMFMRVPEGVHVSMPIQACYLITLSGFSQRVKNVVIAEKNSKATVIAGCSSAGYVANAEHIGITNFYVGENASLDYIMVHSWSEADVKPVANVYIEKKASMIYDYILLSGKGKVNSVTNVFLDENSYAGIFSSIFAEEGHDITIKSFVELGKDAKAENISRIVSAGGKVNSFSKMIGKQRSKGYLECSGILLSEKGAVTAVPSLEALNPEAELFHEASITKIAGEELYYLMARGYSEEEARRKILSGFLTVRTYEFAPRVQEFLKSLFYQSLLR